MNIIIDTCSMMIFKYFNVCVLISLTVTLSFGDDILMKDVKIFIKIIRHLVGPITTTNSQKNEVKILYAFLFFIFRISVSFEWYLIIFIELTFKTTKMACLCLY